MRQALHQAPGMATAEHQPSPAHAPALLPHPLTARPRHRRRPVQHRPVQTLAMAYWCFHYAKRIVETFTVHRCGDLTAAAARSKADLAAIVAVLQRYCPAGPCSACHCRTCACWVHLPPSGCSCGGRCTRGMLQPWCQPGPGTHQRPPPVLSAACIQPTRACRNGSTIGSVALGQPH